MNFFFFFSNCRRRADDVTGRAEASEKACEGFKEEISLVKEHGGGTWTQQANSMVSS